MRIWLSAGLLALLLAAGACQPAPRPAPTAVATSAPRASASGAPSLADELRAAISPDDILSDLGRLDTIAGANGGNRAAGTEGHAASAAFVAEELRDAGYEVEVQPVRLTAFRQDGPTLLEIEAPGAPVFEDVRDYKVMLLSPSGDVTAPVFALGFDPAAQPGDRSGLGCAPDDWSEVPAGVIALVQPAGCRRHDVVVNAQAAGVAAVVTSYADWTAGRILRPTLVQADDIRIPAVGVTAQVGLALLGASQAGWKVHVAASTSIEPTESPNVIAETPGGDAGHVIMLGGHLDSVVDGPGINDNGSGTMAVLEIARELIRIRPEGAAWKVRVAFWTGEELGLFGSAAYAGGLVPDAASTIEAYLNFDMIGSPNGFRQVYEGSGTARPAGSSVVESTFAEALGGAGLAWETADIGGASDHVAFDQLGIPVGGLFSGANEPKSADAAARFGGTAGVPADACYHLACDGVANIDRALLEELARAAAWTVGRLASGEVTVPEG